MSKIHKISLYFLFLSILIIFYFLIFSQKVNTKKIINQNFKNVNNKTVFEQKTLTSTKTREKEYIAVINKFTKEYENFINSLNKKIDLAQADGEDSYVIFDKDDLTTIEKLSKNLSDILVPARYKNFHLLLSRSLLNLSSYINSSNPDEMLTGLKLLDQAKEEYDKLNIG